MKRLEICRPGSFVDVNGTPVVLTEQDLRECATIYNPKQRPAPLVIGHPKLDDPAKGWVAQLDYVDGALVATPERVDPAFDEDVEDRYPNRSAAFFHPSHSANPILGKWYLKHVGFLGAAQPAVDGLKPVEFGLFDEPGGMVVNFAAYEHSIRHRERERVRKEHALSDLLDHLVNEAKIRPTERDVVAAFAANMMDGGVVAFGSGEDRQETDAFTAFAAFLKGRPPLVVRGEICKGDGPVCGAVEFAAPNGVPMDRERADLHARAMAYQQQNRCDYVTAIRAVQRGGR